MRCFGAPFAQQIAVFPRRRPPAVLRGADASISSPVVRRGRWRHKKKSRDGEKMADGEKRSGERVSADSPRCDTEIVPSALFASYRLIRGTENCMNALRRNKIVACANMRVSCSTSEISFAVFLQFSFLLRLRT